MAYHGFSFFFVDKLFLVAAPGRSVNFVSLDVAEELGRAGHFEGAQVVLAVFHEVVFRFK